MLIILIFFYLTITSQLNGACASAITYDVNSCQRFGDQLSLYYKAKLLSWKYGIPLLYKEERQQTYFKQLVMHKAEKHYATSNLKKFTSRVRLNKTCYEIPRKDLPTLYTVCFKLPLNDVGITREDAENPAFKRILRRMIAPRKKLQEVFRPPNCLTLAVHVRKGGGFDHTSPSKLPNFANVAHPHKFPPD